LALQKPKGSKKCQKLWGSYENRVAYGFVVLWSVFLLSFFDIDSKTLQDFYARKDKVFLSRMPSLPVLLQTFILLGKQCEGRPVACGWVTLPASFLISDLRARFIELFDRDNQDDEKSVSFYAKPDDKVWQGLSRRGVQSKLENVFG
jgi:hypothetical protein